MSSIEIVAEQAATHQESVLTPEALAFIRELSQRFTPRVVALLEARRQRQCRLDIGERPDFLPETREIREGGWSIRGVPSDLLDRRVEITGPTDRKMIINALNSGAKVFMADCQIYKKVKHSTTNVSNKKHSL